MSGTIEALLIFVAASWIIFEAIKKIMNPQSIEYVGWGVGVMLVSALVNVGVSKMLFKVGRETDSIALEADAWHLRTDVYTSAGVMISLALIWMGDQLFPDVELAWLDPAAAIGVAHPDTGHRRNGVVRDLSPIMRSITRKATRPD